MGAVFDENYEPIEQELREEKEEDFMERGNGRAMAEWHQFQQWSPVFGKNEKREKSEKEGEAGAEGELIR